jgi:protein-L-isoaspartate(D-aspartate) O-methyltransferase
VLLLAGIAVPTLFTAACAEKSTGKEDFVQKRERMVTRDLAARGITNEVVLEVMGKVPREEFVLPRYRSAASDDSALPIEARQTISQPFIVAAMTEAIRPSREDVVLEVGTGSGYQAAVLAEIVKEVYTIEIVEQLAKQAATRLEALRYTNITVRAGDGYVGWPEHAPFDAIIVTAAPDHVPEPLVKQLKVGARMVIPVGKQRGGQDLLVLEKQSDGSVKQRSLMPVRFVPLTGEHVEPD